MKKSAFLPILILLAALGSQAAETAPLKWSTKLLKQKTEWYASSEARAAADNVLRYQSDAGAWPKNTDLLAPATADAIAEVLKGGKANTIDNGATTAPIRFLARMTEATAEPRYREAVQHGIDYLLAAQYPNGGFPQFYPLRDRGYYSRISYNDGAMINTLELLRDVSQEKAPFEWVDADRRARATDAVARGIDCILKTQIRQNGRLTAWCAQHDEVTLAPAWARAYEPPSLSGAESVGIIRFLMAMPDPSPDVIAAVEGAIAWLQDVAIRGKRIDTIPVDSGKPDRRVVDDPAAPPLLARFYELETNRPLYMDRDSKPLYDFNQVGYERRAGYSYHGSWPSSLVDKDFPAWRARLSSSHSTPSSSK